MIGTTLSHYRIKDKLGAGGMGEVYRAEDTNLDRQVAIKVLPDIFCDDPERMARFEREAKLLASLNHPNIAAIYGLEQADVWAFGCILYECLTGKRAFAGETVTETLAAILKGEPDWRTLPADTPSSIATLLRRCLQKDPRARLHDVADARIEIAEADMQPVPTALTQVRVTGRMSSWIIALLLLMSVAITAVLVILVMRNPRSEETRRTAMQFPLLLPSDLKLTNTECQVVAISPEGTHLAFSANDQLYIRSMSELQPAATLRGTEGFLGDPALTAARSPFFSPDGQWVGFWADRKLRKVPVSGGAPKVLCDCPLIPFGVGWGPGDVIVFGQGWNGIWKVSAEGGKTDPLIQMDSGKGEVAHGPQLLNGGNAVLFTLCASGAPWDDARIVVQDVRSGKRSTLVEGGTDARYIPTGHLVYVREGVLWGQAFDLNRLALMGKPVRLLDGVAQGTSLTGTAQFSFSTNGTFAYVPAGLTDLKRNLVWVSRKGEFVPAVKDVQPFTRLSLSSDGRRAATVYAMPGHRRELWVYDLESPRPPWPLKRNLDKSDVLDDPLLSPDGSQAAFSLNDGLYLMPADGSTSEAECLVTQKSEQGPYSFSSAGNELFFEDYDKRNFAVIAIKGERKPKTILASEYLQGGPAISPNGNWVAYSSSRTGSVEIWVASYPDLKDIRRVSFSGGFEPRWSRDGRELYFWQGKLMMVSGLNPEGQFSVSRELFGGDFALAGSAWPSYGVAPDGRFLMMRDAEAPVQQRTTQQINIIVNWFEELKRLAPTGK